MTESDDLVQAMGLALSLVGVLLSRGEPVALTEFARLLDVLATVTNEASERQGQILSTWAAVAFRTTAANQA